jgi:hypothetical protein
MGTGLAWISTALLSVATIGTGPRLPRAEARTLGNLQRV